METQFLILLLDLTMLKMFKFSFQHVREESMAISVCLPAGSALEVSRATGRRANALRAASQDSQERAVSDGVQNLSSVRNAHNWLLRLNFYQLFNASHLSFR